MRNTLWTLLLLLSATLISCSGPESESPPTLDRGHPIALVIDEGDPRGAESWRAILGERFGGCDLIPAGEWFAGLDAAPMQRQLVVIAHSVLAEPDSSRAGALRRAAAQKGWIILLDRAGHGWETVTGLRSMGERALQLKWERDRWSPWSGSGSDDERGIGSMGPLPTDLDRGLQYLVQRPLIHGVRNMGAPFGIPSLWWWPEGEGGFLSLSIPLTELWEKLAEDPQLGGQERRAWQRAVVELVLGPDAFPRPLPRVWTGSETAAVAAGETAPYGALGWSLSEAGVDSFQLRVRGSAECAGFELGVPMRWRGKVLVDWSCDWQGARTRKVDEFAQEWRLVAAPTREGTLEFRYRQAPGATPWR